MVRTTRAAARTASDTKQLSSPPATPVPASRRKGRQTVKTEDDSPAQAQKQTPKGTKRTRKSIKQEDDDDNELPHNLGSALPTPGADGTAAEHSERSIKRTKLAGSGKKLRPVSSDNQAVEARNEVGNTLTKTPKKKDNYGLTPGVSPYSDYPRPTPEECREVVRLLEKVHGKVTVPKAIPPPSLDYAGCGEVPSVLDALIRTRLSANTTNKNSSTAFKGLVESFGTLKDGIGKGSVDWDAVRRAPQREVYKAIEHGGLADRKSKDIQAILQIAYEENQQRRAALTDPNDAPFGADRESDNEKQEEITKAKQNIISLDHLHLMSTDDAIAKMLTLPGIGPKTASCVALFCLQRPSFAVDTHVFRLCQYLGWVPRSPKKGQPKVDRNTTYSHCDARIPDELKYPLHTLLIKHGKACPRCRATTGQSSAGWDDGCPIEHLVKRHGAKKGGASVTDRRKAALAAGETRDAIDERSEDSELSDAPSDY